MRQTPMATIWELLNDALGLLERQAPSDDQWEAEIKILAALSIAHEARDRERIGQ